MARKIKGIVLEIGGDVQPLEKALADVNKKTRDLQGELKSVERLLKLDPKNTELLAQKQKLLAEQVENSREKLQRLEKAQEQVNAAFRKGDIGEEQYRHFSRQVINAKQDLDKFETELKQTGRTAQETEKKVKDLGESLKKAGEKTSEIGEGISKVGAPIAAGMGLAVMGAAEAESAQGKLQAAMGATKEEAEEMAESAKKVWLDGFGESLPEVEEALTTVKQNLRLANKPLEDFTAGALAIRDIFGADVTETVAAARVMVNNFGISGQKALDIITVGFQSGGDFSGELLDTLREYSPQFTKLGLTAEESMNILIAGAEAGAWNLDKVGDSVKEFSIRAIDGSKTTAEGFAAIGLDAGKMGAEIAKGGDSAKKAFLATLTGLANMKDPVAQNIAGVALFGTQWEDVKAQVILAMGEGIKQVRDFDGATKQAADTFSENNPLAELTKAGREVQNAFSPAILPLAKAIEATVVPIIKLLAGTFAALPAPVQQTIVSALALIVALGPIIFIGGKVIAWAGSFIGVLSKVAPIISKVVSFIVNFIGRLGGIVEVAGSVIGWIGRIVVAVGRLMTPFGWAVTAVLALIAIFARLYKTNDKFREWVDSIKFAVKNGFAEMVNYAVEKINKLIELANNLPGIEMKPINKVSVVEGNGHGTTSSWATGTGAGSHPGGLAWVGERGPELLDLPRGTKVYNNRESMAMVGRGPGGGSQTVNHTGEITVRGVNSMDQLIGVTKIIAKEFERGNRRIPAQVATMPSMA